MTSTDKFIITASQLAISDEQVDELRVISSQITDWEDMYKKTMLHRVASFVYYTLKQNGLLEIVPNNIAEKLHGQYLRNILYNQSLYREIDHLGAALKPFKVVLLKGSALNLDVYPDLGIRPMSDVDVLVYKSERFDTFNALRDAGWIPSDGPVEKSEIHRKVSDVDHKHLPKIHRTSKSGYVELHWKFFAGEDDDFWAKSGMDSAIAYKDNLFILSNELMFAHLCSNFTDGYDLGEPLRTLCDIHEFILKKDLNWGEIDVICKKEPLHSRLLTALNCLHWLFGYEIPSKYTTDEFSGIEPSLDFLALDKIPDRTIGKVRLIRKTFQKCGGLVPFVHFLYKNVFPDKVWLDSKMPPETKYKLLTYWKSHYFHGGK